MGKTMVTRPRFTLHGTTIKTRDFGGEWKLQPSGFPPDERDMDAARLMVAAPVLLEALREAHTKLVDNDLHFVRIDEKCKVCALIARAEGRAK